MNLVVQAPCHLVVDLSAKTGQAAEGRLDMAAGAAEPVIEIEVPERSIQVVPPHQANHPAAEPDAFGVSTWAVDGLGRLDELVGLALVVLVNVGGTGGRRLAGLILGIGGAALGKCASRSDQEDQAGSSQAPQNRNSWIKHPSTHTFPDIVSRRAGGWCDDLACCRPNWTPMRRRLQAIQMTGISDFVQQSHNFIMAVVKLPQAMRRNRAILHLGRSPMNG